MDIQPLIFGVLFTGAGLALVLNLGGIATKNAKDNHRAGGSQWGMHKGFGGDHGPRYWVAPTTTRGMRKTGVLLALVGLALVAAALVP